LFVVFCCIFAVGNNRKKFIGMSRKSAPIKVKEPVKVRFKKLADGNQSIYLAWWDSSREKWQYEFLKLYLKPETTQEAKTENENTLRKAVTIKSRRIDELQNAAHGLSNHSARSKVNLLEYINTLAEKKRSKAGGGNRTTADTYVALAKQITAYSGAKTTFKQVNRSYCQGFIEYLRAVENRNYKGGLLKENTQFGYVRSFEHVLNCAVLDEIIVVNPFKQLQPEDKPKKHRAEICYLTADEIKKLENADFPVTPIVKKAFLFSCYTGLRISDVRGLTWGKMQKDYENKVFINYVQKKTKKQEYLPVPQIALKYLPERGKAKDGDTVFKIPDGSYCNKMLKFWSAAAGISKHLTFHVARHTYATLLLSLDIPIETISKNLAHSEIRTTQIYAKVIHKSQREAVDKLDSLMD